MKKLAIIALLPCAMLISACSNMPYSNNYSGWDAYNFNNMAVDSILVPGYGSSGQPSANYQKPRQYYVTQQDEQEYNAINNRVQQHQQQVQSSMSTVNTSSAISTNTTSTAASTMKSTPTATSITSNNYTIQTPTPTQQNTHY